MPKQVKEIAPNCNFDSKTSGKPTLFLIKKELGIYCPRSFSFLYNAILILKFKGTIKHPYLLYFINYY